MDTKSNARKRYMIRNQTQTCDISGICINGKA